MNSNVGSKNGAPLVMQRVLVALVMVVASGCTPEEGRSDGEDSPAEKLQAVEARLSDLEDAIAELRSNVDELRSAIDGFERGNWRTTVPIVKSATDDVEESLDAVEAAMSEARSAVD